MTAIEEDGEGQGAAISTGETAVRHAISVPLTPVTRGLSRSLADTPQRRSGRTAARIAQIPKLMVRVRFPSPALRRRNFIDNFRIFVHLLAVSCCLLADVAPILVFSYSNKYFELDYDSAKGRVHSIFLPKVHAATRLATQVRIPPPAPQVSHFTGRGVRGTPRAQEGDPLPRRLTRPRRPLPLHGTFSTEDGALAVAKEAERHAAEVADGAAGGLDLCGCAGHRGQRPRTGAR